MLALLKASWLAGGNSETGWKLSEVSAPAADNVPAPQGALNDLRKKVSQDKEQKKAAEFILDALRQNATSFVFCQGCSGTGKSTLASFVHHEALAEGRRVLNVATTGLAALQVPGGSTAHSSFGIPIDNDQDEVSCILDVRGKVAQDLATVSLIQWDEWPAAKRTSWDAVLRLLEDLQSAWPDVYCPKTIVSYGDFRQIPPVVPKGGRQAVLAMSVRSTKVWHEFTHFCLSTKHRQAGDKTYAAWLDSVGDGTASAVEKVNGEAGLLRLSFPDLLEDEEAAIRFVHPHLNDLQSG